MIMTTVTDPHRVWLHDRNEIMTSLNKLGEFNDEQNNGFLDIMEAIETRIVETPARTSDGLIAKMIYALQITVEGSELSTDSAADLIREAQCLLDIGSLAGASDDLRMRRAA